MESTGPDIDETRDDRPCPPARGPRRRRRWIVLVPAVVVMTAALACWRCHPSETPRVPPASAPAPDDDARLRKLVLGTWQDEYEGKRTMTIRQDGTATMVVELDGLKAMMYASRLRFDMEWSIEDGRLKKWTIGGEPALRVRLILEMMGDRVDEPILELTEKRLLLLDGDGETKYDWRRPD